MIDYPDLPDHLNRKLNPNTPTTPEEIRAARAMKRPRDEIVVPPVRKRKPLKSRPLDNLSNGEREELAEIKAMIGTSLDHAKRMTTEWLDRAPDRITKGRRRLAAQTLFAKQRRR